jgi:membrane peptidoglycan carboxypeptidase
MKQFHIKSFIFGVLAAVIFLFLPYFTYTWLKVLPNPTMLSRRDLEVSTKIYDRSGALLYEIYADQNRNPIPISEIPKNIIQATIAIEDKDFYRHNGFSVKGIARSLWEIAVNHRVQGGSTITQQLIKSALLNPEVSILRKIKEIVLAFWAERMYTKNQILEMYFNQVPYGGTAWGIESASQTYYGKSIKDLTLAESALLAGLPAAPSEYSPYGIHPEKAFERQVEVLRRMKEDGYITQEEANAAYKETIHFATPSISLRAPHFVMYIKDLLEKRYGARLVQQGGLRVITSLDVSVQEKMQEIVTSQINSLAHLQVGNGAALVTNPKTGEILAMIGSRDYFDSIRDGNVNVTTSLRQPGSSIKVVTYALALENGFTPATILDDSPVVYTFPGLPSYSPVNYDNKFHGPTPLRYALGNSYNIPAVKVAAKLGVQQIIQKGRSMGIDTWIDESRYGYQ